MSDERIIKTIRRQLKLRNFYFVLCSSILILCCLALIFCGLDNYKSVKLISDIDKTKITNAEKIMINPKIRFEYQDGQIFDIVASKAIQEENNDVELFDVDARGNAGNIKSGNLLITNNGNDLYFSNNPVLNIIENPQ